ncbi:chromosome condensation protein, partial [Reticulomyxa filosa]
KVRHLFTISQSRNATDSVSCNNNNNNNHNKETLDSVETRFLHVCDFGQWTNAGTKIKEIEEEKKRNDAAIANVEQSIEICKSEQKKVVEGREQIEETENQLNRKDSLLLQRTPKSLAENERKFETITLCKSNNSSIISKWPMKSKANCNSRSCSVNISNKHSKPNSKKSGKMHLYFIFVFKELLKYNIYCISYSLLALGEEMIHPRETAEITDKIIVLEDNKKIEAVALGNEKEINEEYAKSDYNMLSIRGKKKCMANITLFKEIPDECKKHFLDMKNYVQKDINHQFGVIVQR